MKSYRALLIFSLLFVISAACVFGQSADPVQLAANTNINVRTKPEPVITGSAADLQAKIEAQQKQIDRLTTLVEKLQASLQPIASTSPMLPSGASAAVPEPSPAAAPPVVDAGYRAPRELLPDIGHIGAELGFFAGGATNPYGANRGFATGGFIDLPWKNVPAGKLSYEIMIGLQRSETKMQTTSGVNVLVNAALNSYLGNTAAAEASPTDFLTGPLPITSTVMERSKVLTVAPFELKYTITKLGRFRPYFIGGVGAYVWIGSDNNTATFDANKSLGGLAGAPVGSSTLGATLNALLKGSQIGGVVPTAPELAARGVPHGQGNLLFGAQMGAGFEIRVAPKLSWGFDFRRNQVEGKNASFNTFAFKQGLHW